MMEAFPLTEQFRRETEIGRFVSIPSFKIRLTVSELRYLLRSKFCYR